MSQTICAEHQESIILEDKHSMLGAADLRVHGDDYVGDIAIEGTLQQHLRPC